MTYVKFKNKCQYSGCNNPCSVKYCKPHSYDAKLEQDRKVNNK